MWWKKFQENSLCLNENITFTLKKQSVHRLCQTVHPHLVKKTTRFRIPVSVDTQITIFLYYISDKEKYRKVANTFGRLRSTISITVRKVAWVIVAILGFIIGARVPSSFPGLKLTGSLSPSFLVLVLWLDDSIPLAIDCG